MRITASLACAAAGCNADEQRQARSQLLAQPAVCARLFKFTSALPLSLVERNAPPVAVLLRQPLHHRLVLALIPVAALFPHSHRQRLLYRKRLLLRKRNPDPTPAHKHTHAAANNPHHSASPLLQMALRVNRGVALARERNVQLHACTRTRPSRNGWRTTCAPLRRRPSRRTRQTRRRAYSPAARCARRCGGVGRRRDGGRRRARRRGPQSGRRRGARAGHCLRHPCLSGAFVRFAERPNSNFGLRDWQKRLGRKPQLFDGGEAPDGPRERAASFAV